MRLPLQLWGWDVQLNTLRKLLLLLLLLLLPATQLIHLSCASWPPQITNPCCPPACQFLFLAGWGADKQDSCPGDSGGPLVKLTRAGYVLCGIVSWGLPTCGVGRGLGAYTDVRLLHKWINQTRTPLGV